MKEFDMKKKSLLWDFIKENVGDIFGALCFAFLCYVCLILMYVFE